MSDGRVEQVEQQGRIFERIAEFEARAHAVGPAMAGRRNPEIVIRHRIRDTATGCVIGSLLIFIVAIVRTVLSMR